jgi:hypothetical protein
MATAAPWRLNWDPQGLGQHTMAAPTSLQLEMECFQVFLEAVDGAKVATSEVALTGQLAGGSNLLWLCHCAGGLT